jgi:hypothetical protein
MADADSGTRGTAGRTPMPMEDVEPLVATDCTSQAIDTASVCAGPDCRIEFAGQLDCPGAITDLDLVATRSELYVHHTASRSHQLPRQVIARLAPASGEFSVVSPVQSRAGLLRGGPSGELALITTDVDRADVYRLRNWPDDFSNEQIEIPGSIVDAVFDRSATLQLFSVPTDLTKPVATFRIVPPRAAEKILDESANLGRARVLGSETEPLR